MDIDWPLATSWTYPLKRGKDPSNVFIWKENGGAHDNNASENHRPKTLYVNTVCTLFVNKKAPF